MKTLASQIGGGIHGANAVVTKRNDFSIFRGGKFRFESRGQLVERNKKGWFDLGGIPFPQLANVEKKKILVGGEPFFDLGGMDFPFGVNTHEQPFLEVGDVATRYVTYYKRTVADLYVRIIWGGS